MAGAQDKANDDLDGPALVHYVESSTFISNGPKDRMVADADRKGHRELLAKDFSAHSASKAFFSLPTPVHVLRYLRQLPSEGRHLYEMVRETEPVRLWFDIEFLSDHVQVRPGGAFPRARQRPLTVHVQDGEPVRERVHGLLQTAVRESFGVQDVAVFWGTSTRQEGHCVKHSYQARVPAVIFPDNATHGLLKRWVDAFAQLTKDDPLLRCPKSGKHVIDTAVYTKNRLVRTCFSSKRKDKSNTVLRLMHNVGAGPNLFGGDHEMRGTDDPRMAGEFEAALAELLALMVRPLAQYAFVEQVVNVADLPQPLRCKGVGVVGEDAVVAAGSSHGQRKRVREDHRDQRVRARRRAQQDEEDDVRRRGVPLPDRSEALVQALALLGPRRCESYEDWQNVLFACKNSCAAADAQTQRRVQDAFVEWSKRASSFQSDDDAVRQFSSTSARSAGRVYTATTLQRWVADDPCVVFAGAADGVTYDGEGKVMLFPDWHSFFHSVDKEKTDWRTLVRVARHLYPGDEQFVVSDVATHMGRTSATAVRRETVAHVWNLPRVAASGSNPSSDTYTEYLRTFVKQRLSMPSLVRDVLPAALVEDDMRQRALEGPNADEDEFLKDGLYTYECLRYGMEEGGNVRFVMQRRLADGVVLDEQREFVLRLADGRVSGTTIHLRSAAKIFKPDQPGCLRPEYKLDTQLHWAALMGDIPAVRDNVRSVKAGPWLVYDAASGLWEELAARDAKLRTYVAGMVRDFLEPLWALLQFSVVVLESNSSTDAKQLKVLESIMSRFASSTFLDSMLDALQGVEGVRIDDFNDVFNLDGYLLPCANGLLDFRTLQLVPLQREHYYTWKAPVAWDAEADMTAPRQFVETLFPDDTENTVKYILEWSGYCLSGLTNMQTLTFMIGYGSNGKSKMSYVMEKILGKVGFAHISYEALCLKSTGPNEELYAGRHARLWQIDENDGDQTLNLAMLKKITGEDTIKCRPMYGHIVTVLARAKMNFAVNKPPKLPAASDLREQSSLWRRFVYVDCPMQFVDMNPGSKDAEKVELFRREMREDRFSACVRQVDINLDAKLDAMIPGFFRLFATALHGLIRPDERGAMAFRAIRTPYSIQQNIARMMRANPAMSACTWLYSNFAAGQGQVSIREMYADFLGVHDLLETNYSLSRFEGDVDKWVVQMNQQAPQCRQTPMCKVASAIAETGGRRGARRRGAALSGEGNVLHNCQRKQAL